MRGREKNKIDRKKKKEKRKRMRETVRKKRMRQAETKRNWIKDQVRYRKRGGRRRRKWAQCYLERNSMQGKQEKTRHKRDIR